MNKKTIWGLSKSLFLILSVIPLSGESTFACPGGTYRSSSYLSALIAGNPLLQVTSDSTELRLSNGSITLSSIADLYADGNGVPFTGNGELKARGRYQLVTRNRKRFIKINSVSADIFTAKLNINGEEASRNDYRNLVFSDRMIEYRCSGNRLFLIIDVGRASTTFTFSRAR